MTYYDNPEVNDWHKQIIIGTVLGGSSLVKPKRGRNCYLFMRSVEKDWLQYKAQELSILSSQRPFTYENNTVRWHSNCYPIFSKYYDMFYATGKKNVTMEILDCLRDIGLAIWYGDCGRIRKNTIILNTNKFGQTGTEMISQYFGEAGIGITKIIKERKYIRLLFTPDATDKFLLTIAHRIPDFMHDRLLND